MFLIVEKIKKIIMKIIIIKYCGIMGLIILKCYVSPSSGFRSSPTRITFEYMTEIPLASYHLLQLFLLGKSIDTRHEDLSLFLSSFAPRELSNLLGEPSQISID